MNDTILNSKETICKAFNELRRVIQEAADLVNEGEIEAFTIGRELSYVKKCIEQAKEKITDAEKAQYMKYSPAELKELKVQLAGGGYTYKYDHIPEWVKLNDQIKSVEEKAKRAFQMSLDNKMIASNEGEVDIAAVGNPKKQSVSYR